MWFVGMLVGLILGGAAWGFDGAVTLGFFGFIGGLIFGNRKKSVSGEAPKVHPEHVDRIGALEQRVDELEARLSRYEGAGAQLVSSAAAQKAELVTAGQVVPDVPAAQPLSAMAAMAAPASANTRAQVPREENDQAPAAAESVTLKPAPATPAEPLPPAEPARPNFIVRWFTEGNAIVRIGVTILFIGMAFLVKYAADHSLLPIELRLAGAAAGGIALLAFGWRLREQRAGYALTLQGAGVAVLYLTIFGAFRLWGLLPAALAFPLLVLIAILSAFLAVRQDSMALAVAGSAGGFLAPILASTGTGSHVMLFSYYLVLNAGILAVAWHKAWRPLNLLGFAFTFVISLLWGERYYQPALYASTEPFLVLHFLLYVLVAVLFAHRQAPRVAHYVDGTLIFGVPLVAFGLQYALVKDTEYGMALSSLALGGFYVVLARVLHARQRDTLRLLVECFLALGVVFGTLAIPLALDARWTSAAWALEGAGIVWIGVRQHRVLARVFGMLLQLLAGAAFLHALERGVGPYPIANSVFLGALLLVLGGLLTYRQTCRKEDVTAGEYSLAGLWFLWGMVWWCFGGLREIDRFIEADFRVTVAVLFMAMTAWTMSQLWLRRGWAEAEWVVLSLLPVLALFALMGADRHGHPFAHWGWAAWPFALFLHWSNLRRHETEEPHQGLSVTHACSILLVAAMGAWELHWFAVDAGLAKSAWTVASVVIIPGLVLSAISSARVAERWPMSLHGETILRGAGVPIVIAFWLWTFYANFTHAGGSAPLPYLPVLNALDLGHLFVLLTGIAWWRRWQPDERPQNWVTVAIGLSAFTWLTAILLRSLHHWADVPYRAARLWDSMLVQASVSLFWTLMALTLMVLATRKAWRKVWMIGAGLMGLVVVKLVLVDFSHVGGIERIVSFIGVGVLMAVIGYLAPLPPAQTADSAKEST